MCAINVAGNDLVTLTFDSFTPKVGGLQQQIIDCYFRTRKVQSAEYTLSVTLTFKSMTLKMSPVSCGPVTLIFESMTLKMSSV